MKKKKTNYVNMLLINDIHQIIIDVFFNSNELLNDKLE